MIVTSWSKLLCHWDPNTCYLHNRRVECVPVLLIMYFLYVLMSSNSNDTFFPYKSNVGEGCQFKSHLLQCMCKLPINKKENTQYSLYHSAKLWTCAHTLHIYIHTKKRVYFLRGWGGGIEETGYRCSLSLSTPLSLSLSIYIYITCIHVVMFSVRKCQWSSSSTGTF